MGEDIPGRLLHLQRLLVVRGQVFVQKFLSLAATIFLFYCLSLTAAIIFFGCSWMFFAPRCFRSFLRGESHEQGRSASMRVTRRKPKIVPICLLCASLDFLGCRYLSFISALLPAYAVAPFFIIIH